MKFLHRKKFWRQYANEIKGKERNFWFRPLRGVVSCVVKSTFWNIWSFIKTREILNFFVVNFEQHKQCCVLSNKIDFNRFLVEDRWPKTIVPVLSHFSLNAAILRVLLPNLLIAFLPKLLYSRHTASFPHERSPPGRTRHLWWCINFFYSLLFYH